MKKKFKIVKNMQTFSIKIKELPLEIFDTKNVKSQTKGFEYIINEDFLILIEYNAFNELKAIYA